MNPPVVQAVKVPRIGTLVHWFDPLNELERPAFVLDGFHTRAVEPGPRLRLAVMHSVYHEDRDCRFEPAPRSVKGMYSPSTQDRAATWHFAEPTGDQPGCPFGR